MEATIGGFRVFMTPIEAEEARKDALKYIQRLTDDQIPIEVMSLEDDLYEKEQNLHDPYLLYNASVTIQELTIKDFWRTKILYEMLCQHWKVQQHLEDATDLRAHETDEEDDEEEDMSDGPDFGVATQPDPVASLARAMGQMDVA